MAPLGYLLSPYLLELVHATPAVRAEALPFLRTMFVFSIGMLMFFMLGGALRAAGDARTPLRLGVALTVLNIALNVMLIPGLGPIPAFGTRGAAIGTSAASALVSGVGLWLLLQRPPRRHVSRGRCRGGPTGASSARCSGSDCRPACRAWR